MYVILRASAIDKIKCICKG